ncbi:hypothetical protein FACS1894133_5350 [Clostridia bacterium]|nr:hypothetical protein FACS1894133_5350 [Clostridia bacterium]
MLTVSADDFNIGDFFKDFSDFLNRNKEIVVISKNEYKRINTISYAELDRRFKDMDEGINCGFHELIEVDDE